MKFRAPAVVFALVAGLVARPAAGALPCEFEGVARVVAVGDVHGAYDGLVTVLRAADIVNEKAEWIGGQAHLVQLGDVVDRGPDSRKAIDLLRRLQDEASAAGGRVHYLLGNHEVLRLLNSMTYAAPGEFAAFTTRTSASLREQMAESVGPGARADVMKMPLGQIELMQAFSPEGEYGAYLRTLNATVHINGVVFVHGGINPAIASLSCGDINDKVHSDLNRMTAQAQLTFIADADDPLWYRGLALEPEETFTAQVDAILTAQRARAMVIGHTPRANGRIGARFGGRIYMIDTGMQTTYIESGRPSALEMTADGFRPIYAPLPVPAPEAEVLATVTPDSPPAPAPATMQPSVP